MGERGACVATLKTLLNLGLGEGMWLTEPCWPAHPRFDAIDPGSNVVGWFLVAAIEQAERAFSHSSYFAMSGLNLDWLCQQPLVSPEMERRRLLRALRTGKPVVAPARLRGATVDHINADLWRALVAQVS